MYNTCILLYASTLLLQIYVHVAKSPSLGVRNSTNSEDRRNAAHSLTCL